MCPACDNFCDYWKLNEICVHNRIMYLFDNDMTILFAVFMSFWGEDEVFRTLDFVNPFRFRSGDFFGTFLFLAAMFLEFWKRYSSEITHRWDVVNFTPEEEHPRPEYLEQLKNVEEKTINFVTRTAEPKVS